MLNTPNLSLPYIMAAQAQKHVTHNEALQALDAVVQLSVKDRDLTAPPANPTEGDRYIIGASATGNWAGKDSQIAAWLDNAWMFHDQLIGWLCWVADEDKLLAWDGTAWNEVSSGGGAGGISLSPATGAKVGINTTADDTNRLAVKSDAVLISHDDVTPGNGSVQVKVNKAAGNKTASFMFQTNWSSRAEIGLTGDDSWHVKVSPDGTNWKDALIIDRSSGVVTMPFTNNGGGGGGIPDAILSHETPVGTAGGSAVAGMNFRPINTIEYENAGVVTLNNGKFQINPAGTYKIEFTSCNRRTGTNQAILRNVTAGLDVAHGGKTYCDASVSVTQWSSGVAVVVIAVPTEFEIKHFCQFAQASYGLGKGGSDAGTKNIHAHVIITKG